MSPAHTATPAARPAPTREQVRRWRRYLADEIAEGQIYRDIAARKDGVERDIPVSYTHLTLPTNREV